MPDRMSRPWLNVLCSTDWVLALAFDRDKTTSCFTIARIRWINENQGLIAFGRMMKRVGLTGAIFVAANCWAAHACAACASFNVVLLAHDVPTTLSDAIISVNGIILRRRWRRRRRQQGQACKKIWLNNRYNTIHLHRDNGFWIQNQPSRVLHTRLQTRV